ncbi:MAG: nuclear transport factor 2 family protein [Gemmatimonadetes bacterium]|nr:nuclear transport factor 2 family protein [Gemmatimonadota bacterium]
MKRRSAHLTGAMALAAALAPLLVHGVAAQSPGAEVTATLDAYHSALAAGDSTTALSLLTEDATILESGGVETKDHYRSGHLAGDIRFAAAVPRERSDITVTVIGDVAWAWSTSVTKGTMGEREINSVGAELAVLVRRDGVWRIQAFHWSSRAAR